MNQKKITIGHRKPLVEKLLLVNGLSRAGKFLLCNILNGLKDVEPVQYPGILEHIPFMQRLGLIEKRTAEELLHHEIDLYAYEQLIGRNINYRRSDKSSIFNVAEYRSYLKRPKEENTDTAFRRYRKRGAWSLFLVHELANINLFYETFPGMKVINIIRSPVDLVYEWFTRYDIMGWGNNPKFFPIPAQGKKGLLPWFMYKRAKEYESLARGMDRTILMMEVLFADYTRYGRTLSRACKKRTLAVCYEDLLQNPAGIVRTLSRFLGKKPHRDMMKILKRERLPNHRYFEKNVRGKKLAYIRTRASHAYYARLRALEERYNYVRMRT